MTSSPATPGSGPRREPLRVVFVYRRTGKFAFHALAGALETDPAVADVPLVFAPAGEDELAAAVRGARAAAARVLVCWSFYTPDFPAIRAALAAVRAAVDDPAVVHVAGGVHASAEPVATLEAGFDLVARGEGELLIRELVATLRDGGDPRAVTGVGHLDAAGGLQLRGQGMRVVLDDVPPFAPGHHRLGPIEITRGCVYACRFCQTPFFASASFRHRSVANVRHWAGVLVARGFRDLRFLTPTSLSYGASGEEPDLAAVEALLAGVREIIGPDRRLFYGTFPSEVRPEHVTPAALALLRRHVDNDTLIVGGQSGSDRVLAHSRRGHGVAEIERAVALCLEAGFRPHVDFLFGMPGEAADDVRATLDLAGRLVDRGARVHGHTFMPLPGTPFRRARPAALTASTRRALEALTSRGALYGQWRQQEALARRMAAERESGASGRAAGRR